MTTKRNKHLSRMIRKTRQRNQARAGGRINRAAASVTVHREQLPTLALLDVPDWRSARHLAPEASRDAYSAADSNFARDFRWARDLAQSRSRFGAPHISPDTVAGWAVVFADRMETRYERAERGLMLDRIEAILAIHEALLVQRIESYAAKVGVGARDLIPSSHRWRTSDTLLTRPSDLAL